MCLLKQLQLGSYIHPCTNYTHSLVYLQDLIPTLAGVYCLYVITTAKAEIKCAREYDSFAHQYSYQAVIVFE